MSTPDRLIRVAAVVLRDVDGRVLTVRKRGTDRFMLPGGKPEGDETWRGTAVRELAEELGLVLDADRLVELPVVEAPAANEPWFALEKHAFAWPDVVAGTPAPAAEIEEVRWFSVEELLDPPADILIAPALQHGTARHLA